jgi:predicted CXXCH cytochrome family protein
MTRTWAATALSVVVGLVALLVPASARADEGPHGGYTATNTPDGCAACHRAHTAQGELLLVASSTYDLCTTCHGTTGTGANTNVIDGVYTARRSPGPSPLQGVAGAGLLAGGFANTVMNTDFGEPPGSRPVTSSHSVDGTTPSTVWGFGPIDPSPNPGLANVVLDCSNCHDPHGNAGSLEQATYRILRSQPTGVGTLTTVADVPDRTTKIYTVSDASGSTYFGQNYPGYGGALARFCAQCHTRYLAGGSAGKTDSGDAIFTYRHPSSSNAVNCLTCHVAHGSSAQMTGEADMLAVTPGLGVTTGTDSALLRLDDRGVCVQCHDSP